MNSPLVKIANLFNKWSVFHAGAGLVLAKIGMMLRFDKVNILYMVLIIALVWEMIEYIIENWRVYGSVEAWRTDTLMDIILAMVFAYITIL